MATRVKIFTPEELDVLPQGPLYDTTLADGSVVMRMMDVEVLWHEDDDPMIQYDSVGRPWRIGYSRDFGFFKEVPRI